MAFNLVNYAIIWKVYVHKDYIPNFIKIFQFLGQKTVQITLQGLKLNVLFEVFSILFIFGPMQGPEMVERDIFW